MHRKSIIIVALAAVLAVTGITVGLVETRAQGEPEFATITAAQLLANVAQYAGDNASVSGAVSWKNDVLGLSALSFNGEGMGGLTSLLASGSGRLWVQGGEFRFEIQGAAGDTNIVGSQTSVWVYSSSGNTATEYTLPAGTSGTSASTTSTSAAAKVDPVTAINTFIQNLAPTAVVAVSGQETVAGRAAYVLSLVPKAPNTVFGSVQVAIDSTTYLPLRLEIFAKGDAQAVLSAGFESVSYSTIADSTFAFTPPAGAKVDHKTLSLPAGLAGKLGNEPATTPTTAGTPVTGDSATTAAAAGKAPLTLAEAAAKAGFTPLAPQTTSADLAFGGAFVIPVQQVDLQSLLSSLGSGLGGLGGLGTGGGQSAATAPTTAGATTSGASTSDSSTSSSLPSFTLPTGTIALGPTVILRYGQGFGSVVLVEAKLPSQLITQLEQTLASVPLLSRTTVAGGTAYQFNTALGSVMLWDKDGLLLLAAGSVSQSDLMGFAANVR